MSLTMRLLTLLLVSGTSSAYAQDTRELCAPEVELRRAEMVHEGAPGIWFQADVARCLLGDLRELAELRLLVPDLELRQERSDEYAALLVEQAELAVAASERAQEALSAAVRGRREAEEALGAWWRSPWLWMAVGAVIAGGLIALSAYALDSRN